MPTGAVRVGLIIFELDALSVFLLLKRGVDLLAMSVVVVCNE